MTNNIKDCLIHQIVCKSVVSDPSALIAELVKYSLAQLTFILDYADNYLIAY